MIAMIPVPSIIQAFDMHILISARIYEYIYDSENGHRVWYNSYAEALLDEGAACEWVCIMSGERIKQIKGEMGEKEVYYESGRIRAAEK